jgi:hypothetical protein
MAAIFGFFWRGPQKSPCLERNRNLATVAGVFSESSQVELETQLRNFAFPGNESRDEVRLDFFGAHPKKVDPFLAPQKSQKSPRHSRPERPRSYSSIPRR